MNATNDITPLGTPVANTDTLEDSALLAALDSRDGTLDTPDGTRLVSQGLATTDGDGSYFLSALGRERAEEMRARERDLISDDMLRVITKHVPRATARSAGWISGVTWYEERPYIDLVRPADLPAKAFPQRMRDLLAAVHHDARSVLGLFSEVDGNRLLFGALRPSPRGVTPRLGEPDDERDKRIAASGHADAVWSDLCASDGRPSVHAAWAPGDGKGQAPMGYAFHYASRTALLTLEDGDQYTVSFGVSGQPDAGRTWTGHRADVAVKAMARDLYGTLCAHEYGTGRDSCPGCDYTGEEFESAHKGELTVMPGSLPKLTRVVFDDSLAPLNVIHKVHPEG
jgi:hypothetical protein